MEEQLPVYGIHQFQHFNKRDDFYANHLKRHVEDHHFTNLPHKHDFYLVILFTKGKGIHEIDFETYHVKPGALFIMKPGQMHFWKLSSDVEGYVFFHTKHFYDEGFASYGLQNFTFFNSFQVSPITVLKDKLYRKFKEVMAEIFEEYTSDRPLKLQKLHVLISLLYIELSRSYLPLENVTHKTYVLQLGKFEQNIEAHYKTLKSAGDYAQLLSITEKHLNRITKTCLNKTSTQLIAERIILEAKRMLIHSSLNVTEVAETLGYNDKSYFIRFFKKQTGETPLAFLNRYKSR